MRDPYEELSARERQIMDAVHRLGEATVADLRDALPDPPTESAVRTMLMRLEDKGLLRHRTDGRLNRYRATRPHASVRRSALQRIVRTFFDDSPVKTVAALLDESVSGLSDEEVEHLEAIIARARRKT